MQEGSEEVVSHKFFFSRQKQPCKVHMEVRGRRRQLCSSLP